MTSGERRLAEQWRQAALAVSPRASALAEVLAAELGRAAALRREIEALAISREHEAMAADGADGVSERHGGGSASTPVAARRAREENMGRLVDRARQRAQTIGSAVEIDAASPTNSSGQTDDSPVLPGIAPRRNMGATSNPIISQAAKDAPDRPALVYNKSKGTGLGTNANGALSKSTNSGSSSSLLSPPMRSRNLAAVSAEMEKSGRADTREIASPLKDELPSSPLSRTRPRARTMGSPEASPSNSKSGSEGGQAATADTPSPRDLARGLLRNATRKQQLDRMDSVRRMHNKDAARASKESGATKARQGQGEDHSKNLVDHMSYLLARGEVRKVKKKVTAMVAKSSSRQQLFSATDKLGQTILHLAVLGCPSLIQPLADKKVPLDTMDLNGWTALSCAALRGDDRIFRLLLDLGAKPDAQALHFFCGNFCSVECATILDKMLAIDTIGGKRIDLNGPAPNSITQDTPLHSAVANRREDLLEEVDGASLLVDILLRRNADPNIANTKGDYPLHWAVLTGNIRCAKLLIVGGADIAARNQLGETAEELAFRRADELVGEQQALSERMAICLKKSREAMAILSDQEFHSDESFAQIMRAFVADEVGTNAFLGITSEIFRDMGIRNAANIAVLLQKQQTMKASFAKNGRYGVAALDMDSGSTPSRSSGSTFINLRAQSILRRVASSAHIAKGPDKRGGAKLMEFGTRRLGGKADASVRAQLSHALGFTDWISRVPIGFDLGMRQRHIQVSLDPARVRQQKLLDERLKEVKLEKKPGQLQQEASPDCLFLACAEELLGSPERSGDLRVQVASWLRKNKKFKSSATKPVDGSLADSVHLHSFVTTTSWSHYCEGVEKAQWGDPLSLIAISEIFGCRIFVVSSISGDNWAIWITPTKQKSSQTVLLSHSSELQFGLLQHAFNSVVFDRTLTESDTSSIPLLSSNEDALVPLSDLELGAVICEGRRGTLFKGRWRGVAIAGKRLNVDVVSSANFDQIRGEISMLKRLRHPHILLFLAWAQGNEASPQKSEVILVHEFMERGSLHHWLRTPEAEKIFGTLDTTTEEKAVIHVSNTPAYDRAWTLRIKLASDIASGMHYLHSMGVIHRSLSSKKVLLDGSLHCKVGGFGLGRVFAGTEQADMFDGTSLAWTAPEIFNAVPCTKLVDVYSFGVLLWELMTRQEPYVSPRSLGNQEIIIGVAQGTVRPHMPKGEAVLPPFCELAETCWSHQQIGRPPFDAILGTLQDVESEIRARASHRSVANGLFGDLLDPVVGLSEAESESEEGNIVASAPAPSSSDGTDATAVTTAAKEGTVSQFTAHHFWQLDYRDLVFDPEKDKIGLGRSATVYRGKFRGSDVAIKELKDIVSDDNRIEFQRELEILSTTRTPALVYFFGACLTPKMCIVTEFMEAGTLYDRMQDRSRPLTWADVIRYASHAAKAINSLHTWKPSVVHRDVKPTNMLLDNLDRIKLCDLGLARHSVISAAETLRKSKGTPKYMAPEVYMYGVQDAAKPSASTAGLQAQETLGFSTCSDVFSYAIVLWELVMCCYVGSYKTPYYSDNKALIDASIIIQVARNALRPQLPVTDATSPPASLVELIRWAWRQDPTKRPTLGTVILTLKNIKKEYNENREDWDRRYAEVRTLRIQKAKRRGRFGLRN